jgi:crotonobetainyl-CoA:carnitine CoA-transferase CaiB-like acyl-CoA transferase
MSDTPAAGSAHVAALGENTEQLLAEIGYKPSQITDLLNPQHPSP